MPQSLSNVLVRIVFSTKHRKPMIDDGVRDELHGDIGGIIGNLKGTLLHAGSVEDHIHLLAVEPRTASQSELIEAIKTGSSKWIKTKGRQYGDFHWQDGYGIFSISPSHRTALEAYLDRQAEHHRRESFQDEFRRLSKKYEMEFDERYVWD